MNRERLKNSIAPCGLCCETCFAHADGEIQQLSTQLKEKLGNFHLNAKRFESLMGDPVFRQYPAFKEMLDYFAAGHCRGCRKEQCRLFKDCGVRPCHQEKGIDFCYQCEEFPCGHTRFDESLYQTWVAVNERIREQGIEAHAEKTRSRPRYG